MDQWGRYNKEKWHILHIFFKPPILLPVPWKIGYKMKMYIFCAPPPPPPPQCNMYDFLFFAPFHTCMTTQFVIFYNQNINQFSPKNVIFSRVATLHVIKRNLWDGRAQKRGNFRPNWNLIYIFCSLHPTLQDFEVDSVSRNLTLSKTITRWFINHSISKSSDSKPSISHLMRENGPARAQYAPISALNWLIYQFLKANARRVERSTSNLKCT